MWDIFKKVYGIKSTGGTEPKEHVPDYVLFYITLRERDSGVI